MSGYRYLLPLFLLLLARSACAQGYWDDHQDFRVMLGIAPREFTYTLNNNLIPVAGTSPSTAGAYYVSLQLDTIRGFTPHWTKTRLIYLDFLAYTATTNYNDNVPTIYIPDGNVLSVLGIGFGYGIQRGHAYLNAGLGAYAIGLADNVHTLNGRIFNQNDCSLGGKIMAGVTLGRYLSIEGGTTYLKSRALTPGFVMGLACRL
jgi:hypothetical protein